MCYAIKKEMYGIGFSQNNSFEFQIKPANAIRLSFENFFSNIKSKRRSRPKLVGKRIFEIVDRLKRILFLEKYFSTPPSPSKKCSKQRLI
jgi:hypothetical protein